MEQRYYVHHGRVKGWCLWDCILGKYIFSNDSKPRVIAESQRLNGFTPIDGSEDTYADQTRRAADGFGTKTVA